MNRSRLLLHISMPAPPSTWLDTSSRLDGMESTVTRPNLYPSALIDAMKDKLGNRARLNAQKDDTLAQLVFLADIQKSLAGELPKTVQRLRDLDASWAEIGSALGVSKQAAQQRWGA